ncbi:TetR/AcrR family transcriptional regulator [Streptomyces yaizuensis]|uniref:TetR/AcrR family transcriptional regulator n=1 Tax=Streptomyces yaizuensis TaxID=2989713 RepID=A0ABQ5NSR5_9ACTN|nr:helix-turn-helix domain-containing protein [Streptomyces sp. YSPA8]GLF93400.1 TetR/AcrR family transcriptional regulator [Streptomyces sp. YSPA8]
MHSPDSRPVDLPLVPFPAAPAPAPPGPRADAAHNRRKILDAAARLVADQGPDALTMNAVARAAGTGVGTVYRRFGDVSQLFSALLDEREQQFQEAFMAGPPPLGPGAPPGERLRAFLYALADRVIDQRALLLAGENASPIGRYHHDSYLARHTHLTLLVRGVRPAADAPLLAHLLLAPFAPSLITHLTRERGQSAEQIKKCVDDLVAGVLPD